MEVKLLSTQSMLRLSECESLDAAFRTLLDMGFAAGISVDNCDFDSVFEYEEQKTVAFLNEFNVDGALNAFLLQYDFLALKALLKAKLTGKDSTNVPYEGLYGADSIKGWIAEEDEEKLPPYFKDVIVGVLKGANVTPHYVDSLTDKKMYECIFASIKKQNKLMRQYFTRKADFADLLTLMRARKLGLSKQFVQESLLGVGELKGLDALYEATDEQLKDRLKGTAYYDIAAKALDDGKFAAYEVAADNALLRMWRAERDDMFSEAPIVCYYLSRCTEIKVAKLIISGVKNGVKPEIIRERMRDLYA